MGPGYNRAFVSRIEPEFNAFMERASQVRWTPNDIAYDQIDRSKLKLSDLFAVFVTLHIENYSDVYTELLVSAYDDVPLIKQFTLNWEREEENHARALERYLIELGMPLDELKANYAKVDKRSFPVPSRDQAELNAFVFLQELFTREMYAKMLKAAQEPVLRDLLKRIVRDEERHFRFYKQALTLRLELDRPGTLKAIKKIFRIFWMPQTMFRQRAMTDQLVEFYPYSIEDLRTIAKPVASLIEEPSVAFLERAPKLQFAWKNRNMILFGLQSRYLHKHLGNVVKSKLGLKRVSANDKDYVEQALKRLTLLLAAGENKRGQPGASATTSLPNLL